MNWFPAEHPQQVVLKTFTGLCSKPPTKAKRLRMGFTLDLSSGEAAGLPDWLSDARDFVMKSGQTVTEKLQVPGVNLAFNFLANEPNLFKRNPVEAPRCDLRKFVVYQAGEEDSPSTLLSFTAYAPFSTDLNRWLGQMIGESFTATFDGALPEAGDVIAVNASSQDAEDEDGDDITADDFDDEDDRDQANADDGSQLSLDGEDEEDEIAAQERRRLAKAQEANAAMVAANDPRVIAYAKRNLSLIH